MRSLDTSSTLGQDMVIPGRDVPVKDCPRAVVDRCWEVARCFQDWEVTRLDELVENWPAIAYDFEQNWVLAIFDCATQDLEPVEPVSDAADNLALFATSTPDEVVFAFACGPLLQDPGVTKMAAFVHFSVRYDKRGGTVVGKAFDFYVDFG